MHRRILAAAFAFSCLLPGALFAQQATPAAPPPSTTVELTAFVGRQSGEDFSDQATGQQARLHSADNAGLILGVNLAPDIQLEFLYSRADTSLKDDTATTLADLKMEHLHMGAAYVYSAGHVRPFLSVTAGATRLDPKGSGYDSDTHFSLGIGGGVKFFLTDHIGLRLEARAYAIQVDSDSAAFCNNGTCRVYYDGDFLFQYAAHAGIAIAF